MSDRPPSGQARPKLYADGGSTCSNRDLTYGNVNGSVNFSNVVSPGTHPSNNVSQQVPQADYVATGGSCVNADRMTFGDVKGDVNFSGAVGETLPSSKKEKAQGGKRGPEVSSSRNGYGGSSQQERRMVLNSPHQLCPPGPSGEDDSESEMDLK